MLKVSKWIPLLGIYSEQVDAMPDDEKVFLPYCLYQGGVLGFGLVGLIFLFI